MVGVLALAGCAARQGWEYKTISGANDKVLSDPVADGWQPIGLCITPDGQRWFLLKRQKELARPGNWQYKTVIGRTDEVLDNPTNQGWNVIGFALTAGNENWYLLKKSKT